LQVALVVLLLLAPMCAAADRQGKWDQVVLMEQTQVVLMEQRLKLS